MSGVMFVSRGQPCADGRPFGCSLGSLPATPLGQRGQPRRSHAAGTYPASPTLRLLVETFQGKDAHGEGNGTRVNGRPIACRVLNDGDVITFGTARCRIEGLPQEELVAEAEIRRSATQN